MIRDFLSSGIDSYMNSLLKYFIDSEGISMSGINRFCPSFRKEIPVFFYFFDVFGKYGQSRRGSERKPVMSHTSHKCIT
jgi:hypothetical protein